MHFSQCHICLYLWHWNTTPVCGSSLQHCFHNLAAVYTAIIAVSLGSLNFVLCLLGAGYEYSALLWGTCGCRSKWDYQQQCSHRIGLQQVYTVNRWTCQYKYFNRQTCQHQYCQQIDLSVLILSKDRLSAVNLPTVAAIKQLFKTNAKCDFCLQHSFTFLLSKMSVLS